jgi:hypothetical protein
MVFEEEGTYVQTKAVFSQNRTHEWNHGLGEIVTALLAEGLSLTMLVEHDSVPWEALPGLMEQVELGEWRCGTGPSACRTPTRCRRSSEADPRCKGAVAQPLCLSVLVGGRS